MSSSLHPPRTADLLALGAATALPLLALGLHLLAALFSGLLVYVLVHWSAPLFGRRFSHRSARLAATVLLSVVVVLALLGMVFAVLGVLRYPAEGLDALWTHVEATLVGGQLVLPSWLSDRLPASAQELRQLLNRWFDNHTVQLGLAGKEVGITLAQVLIAMVIGALMALQEFAPLQAYPAVTKGFVRCVADFHAAFVDVVGAQLRIALINAGLTSLFLALVLPLVGWHLPFVKTLVLITLIVGMLPVVGNVISNSLVVVVAASVSPLAAGLSLVFLVALHKGEYFLNARIVGERIHARAWELLLAMLVMEAAFGLPGVAAAPVFYAYWKRQLRAGGWLL